MQQFSSAFENLFADVYPLGPTRVQPKRSYHWEGEDPESIGQSGEDMIDSLLNARVNQTNNSLMKGKMSLLKNEYRHGSKKWILPIPFLLNELGHEVHRDYDVLIQKGSDSAKVTLADMGYGLSQFLPVLVHCYYAPEGSTLILEQPDIHLHPKGTSPTCGSVDRGYH